MDSSLDKIFRWLRYKKVIKHIPKNSMVCDIGCGQKAHFLKEISSLIKSGIGFDDKVENYRDSKYELKKLKISEEIPLEKESCDAVTMIAVLEHLSDPQIILNESFRVLKKDGKLILTTPVPLAKPFLEFLAFRLRLINKDDIKDHKNYFCTAEIKKILVESGFREENIKNYLFLFCFNNLIVAQK